MLIFRNAYSPPLDGILGPFSNKYKGIINAWFTSSAIYFSKCLLNGRKLILLHFVVDEKSKQQGLQDIQEGLQVMFLSLGPIFYIG